MQANVEAYVFLFGALSVAYVGYNIAAMLGRGRSQSGNEDVHNAALVSDLALCVIGGVTFGLLSCQVELSVRHLLRSSSEAMASMFAHGSASASGGTTIMATTLPHDEALQARILFVAVSSAAHRSN